MSCLVLVQPIILLFLLFELCWCICSILIKFAILLVVWDTVKLGGGVLWPCTWLIFPNYFGNLYGGEGSRCGDWSTNQKRGYFSSMKEVPVHESLRVFSPESSIPEITWWFLAYSWNIFIILFFKLRYIYHLVEFEHFPLKHEIFYLS